MKKQLNILLSLFSPFLVQVSTLSCGAKLQTHISNDATEVVYEEFFGSAFDKKSNSAVNVYNDKTKNYIDNNFSLINSKNTYSGYQFYSDEIPKKMPNEKKDEKKDYFIQNTKKIDDLGVVQGYKLAQNSYKSVFSQGKTVSLQQYNGSNVSDNKLQNYQSSLDSIAQNLDINPNTKYTYNSKNKSYKSEVSRTDIYDFSTTLLYINSNDRFYFYSLKDEKEYTEASKLEAYLYQPVTFYNVVNNKYYKENVLLQDIKDVEDWNDILQNKVILGYDNWNVGWGIKDSKNDKEKSIEVLEYVITNDNQEPNKEKSVREDPKPPVEDFEKAQDTIKDKVSYFFANCHNLNKFTDYKKEDDKKNEEKDFIKRGYFNLPIIYNGADKKSENNFISAVDIKYTYGTQEV